MSELKGIWPRLIGVSLVCVLLMGVYCYALTVNGIIPLAGKKAPSFVIVLLAQVYLAKNWVGANRGASVHFLKLFLYQYIFVVITALIGAFALYYFYESASGLDVLQDYIRISVNELGQYKDVIIKQEGKEYYFQLMQGIQGINAFSIARDEFSQKLFLAFLPNLLISLYYKQ
ncbi:hypothetical protein [Aquirufa sp. TARAVU-A1A]|jgi:hypothetical protein